MIRSRSVFQLSLFPSLLLSDSLPEQSSVCRLTHFLFGVALVDNIGYLIYKTGTSSTLHWFLVGSTTILFLIGAGLFSKAIGYFEYYTFAKGVGGDVAETGDGPGSFRVAGNVWHLTYGMSLVFIVTELTEQETPRLEVLPPTEAGKSSTLFLDGVGVDPHNLSTKN
jgi:hypothetical protein